MGHALELSNCEVRDTVHPLRTPKAKIHHLGCPQAVPVAERKGVAIEHPVLLGVPLALELYIHASQSTGLPHGEVVPARLEI